MLFEDGAFHRVMYRVAYDRSKLRRLRFVAEGTEHIVHDGGIVLLSCLMKPNYPPIEHTEERSHTFDPLLEIHPSGCEDFEVTVIKNTMKRDWGPWKDYPPREKKRFLHLAEENRTSLFKKRVWRAGTATGVKLRPTRRLDTASVCA